MKFGLYILIIQYLYYSIDCFKNYDVESGEISSPVYTSLDSGNIFCSYNIKVPKGRRITVEIIKGKSLIQNCEKNALPENRLKEKLKVNINNQLTQFTFFDVYLHIILNNIRVERDTAIYLKIELSTFILLYRYFNSKL